MWKMKINQAISILSDFIVDETDPELREAHSMAIAALERDRLRGVLLCGTDGKWGECLLCGSKVVRKIHTTCWRCGNQLSWEL